MLPQRPVVELQVSQAEALPWPSRPAGASPWKIGRPGVVLV